MKKLALATALLFASSMFVMAQSTTSPAATDQQQPSATSPSSTSPSSNSTETSTMPSSDQASQSSMGSSSEESIQGCLSQGANGFTLAASSGTTYNLTGDTSKLSSHVGEEVQVKGTPSSSSSEAASSTAPSSAASSTSPSSSSSNQSFEVKSVKRISKSCSTSGASSNPSK